MNPPGPPISTPTRSVPGPDGGPRRSRGAGGAWPGRTVVFISLVCALIGVGFRVAGQTPARQSREQALKAVSVAKLPLFVNWPPGIPGRTNGPFVIGVLGNDPIGELLATELKDKVIEGRPVRLIACRDAREAADCQLVFIAGSDPKAARDICRHLAGSPALTVSDGAGFAKQGGMVGLVVVRRKVRLELNPEAAQQAGLRFDPNLLQMAELIHSSPADPSSR